jgi:hypothetical protein
MEMYLIHKFSKISHFNPLIINNLKNYNLLTHRIHLCLTFAF